MGDTRCSALPVVPLRRGTASRPRGFTLIELVICLAIIGLLLSIVAPRYWGSVTRAEEAVLRVNLQAMRDALDKHYADRNRYPETLETLVDERYLRAVPQDPITGSSATWLLVPHRDRSVSGIFDVQSGAAGRGRDGRPYADY